jgi:O-antigen/teichoic acid export membrane protein
MSAVDEERVGSGESVGDLIKRLTSGLGWNAAGQAAMVGINIGLTPFLLFHLGSSRYGLFALISSIRGLLSNLDGGLGPTGYRYFAVYAGAGNRRDTSSFFATILALTVVVVGTVATVVGLFAYDITGLFQVSSALHESATALLQGFMPILLVAALRLPIQRILLAENRWALYNLSQVVAMAVYGGSAVGLLLAGKGLTGMLYATAAQEAVLLAFALAGARRYIDLRHLRLMPRGEVRAIIGFAARVQMAAVASSFNYEVDAILVGVLFPVRFVAFYSIGSNFALQLSTLAVNGIDPVAVSIGRAFGQHGRAAADRMFETLQRVWVRALAPFALFGAAGAYYGIDKWLGRSGHLAGEVAAILLAGQATLLLVGVLDALGKAVNMPGLESRYLALGMVFNIAVTIPLALWIGVLGVPIGTAIGQTVSAGYFIWLARRHLGVHLRSPLAEVPYLAVALAVVATTVLEAGAHAVAPGGAGGLLFCALPVIGGYGLYALMVARPGPGMFSSGWSRPEHRVLRGRAPGERELHPTGGNGP